MRKRFIIPVGLLLLGALSASSLAPANPLTGRWQQRWRKGAIMRLHFRPDSTFDAFVNGKAFGNGTYYVRQDTVGISDGVCNTTYSGSYKMHFYAPDSVRWTVITDTCGARRRLIDKGTLSRVSASKP